MDKSSFLKYNSEQLLIILIIIITSYNDYNFKFKKKIYNKV